MLFSIIIKKHFEFIADHHGEAAKRVNMFASNDVYNLGIKKNVENEFVFLFFFLVRIFIAVDMCLFNKQGFDIYSNNNLIIFIGHIHIYSGYSLSQLVDNFLRKKSVKSFFLFISLDTFGV